MENSFDTMEEIQELHRIEEHRLRHEKLHASFMELLHDFLMSKEHIHSIPLDTLVEWSHQQTLKPDHKIEEAQNDVQRTEDDRTSGSKDPSC